MFVPLKPLRRAVVASAAGLMLSAGGALAQPVLLAAEPRGELIHPVAARFIAADTNPDSLVPSMGLIRPFDAIGQVPRAWATVPEFFETAGGHEGFRIETGAGTSLYGTGEVSGPLLRNGRVTETWNLDAYGYGDDAPNLYKSFPWVLALRDDGTAFGVYADTTYRVKIDLTDGIEMVSDGPDFAVIVIEADSPQEVVMAFADLTGKIEMPPKWALGYHQCRYSYYPEARALEVASGFRERNIPADVIWFDIDYMDEFRVFTFDDEHYPDPASTNQKMHDMDFSTIWMIDPGVKKDPGYFVYDQGTELDAWVKNAKGETYVGAVWPGDCVFPDYTNESVREWWATLYHDFMATGIDGVWNDMNEPAVFNVDSKTMPESNIHRADESLGGTGTHARFHNVYGRFMIEATRDGIMAANPHKRPFVLSRAGHVGLQRFGATWTGDNTADWYHLDVSVPMVLNMGLSGHPFTGPDIGGFQNNGDAELFERWIGVGAFYPFSRGHTGKGNIDKEPWAFGEEVENTARQALERRYRFMPYLYTRFREAHETGMPVVRPLFFHDPLDPALRSEDDAFLFGGDVLIVPQHSPQRNKVVALPADAKTGGWVEFDFDDGDNEDLPRMMLRAGSIVPTGPVVQSTRDKGDGSITLLIALDKNGEATGDLYEDEGDGWSFRDGNFLHTAYSAKWNNNAVEVTASRDEGHMPRPDRKIIVRVLLADGTEATATGRDGETIRVDAR